MIDLICDVFCGLWELLVALYENPDLAVIVIIGIIFWVIVNEDLKQHEKRCKGKSIHIGKLNITIDRNEDELD